MPLTSCSVMASVSTHCRIVLPRPGSLPVSALSDRFMPRAGDAQQIAVNLERFQYPLCRIDSCHCGPSRVHGATNLDSSLSVSALSDRFMPRDPGGRPGVRPDLSVSALSDRFMPRCFTAIQAPTVLSVSALSDRFMPPRLLRRQWSMQRCCSFQYPLCRIDSCHGNWRNRLTMISMQSFSIRSVGSIHAT